LFAMAIHPLRVYFDLILCCKYNDSNWELIMYSTMVSKRMIAWFPWKSLTTMSSEISILFKIVKNSLAICVYMSMVTILLLFFVVYILTFNIFI